MSEIYIAADVYIDNAKKLRKYQKKLRQLRLKESTPEIEIKIKAYTLEINDYMERESIKNGTLPKRVTKPLNKKLSDKEKKKEDDEFLEQAYQENKKYYKPSNTNDIKKQRRLEHTRNVNMIEVRRKISVHTKKRKILIKKYFSSWIKTTRIELCKSYLPRFIRYWKNNIELIKCKRIQQIKYYKFKKYCKNAFNTWVEYKIKKMRNKITDCSICYETLQDDNKHILDCDHIFCFTCIFKWIEANYNPTCPMCRSPITIYEDNVRKPDPIYMDQLI